MKSTLRAVRSFTFRTAHLRFSCSRRLPSKSTAIVRQ